MDVDFATLIYCDLRSIHIYRFTFTPLILRLRLRCYGAVHVYSSTFTVRFPFVHDFVHVHVCSRYVYVLTLHTCRLRFYVVVAYISFVTVTADFTFSSPLDTHHWIPRCWITFTFLILHTTTCYRSRFPHVCVPGPPRIHAITVYLPEHLHIHHLTFYGCPLLPARFVTPFYHPPILLRLHRCLPTSPFTTVRYTVPPLPYRRRLIHTTSFVGLFTAPRLRSLYTRVTVAADTVRSVRSASHTRCYDSRSFVAAPCPRGLLLHHVSRSAFARSTFWLPTLLDVDPYKHVVCSLPLPYMYSR